MYGNRILFLLKKNNGYSSYPSSKASGLFNSAVFICETLKSIGVKAELKICIDGNECDKYLHQFKPNICIVEALWVTPEKIQELTKLYPKTKFIIRIHSNIPFLSNEGIAIEWIKKYTRIENVHVSFNNLQTTQDFAAIGIKGIYLPNIYLAEKYVEKKSIFKLISYYFFKNFNRKNKFLSIIHIGCFCAIRPMKNMLIQAMAAIAYADENNKILFFHINSSRVEQKGDSTLKNIRSLFAGRKHKLIEYDWMLHDKFLQIISSMDIGLQVSLSESFNIVTADFVNQKIPIIVSEEISWMPDLCKVKNNSVKSIEKKIGEAIKYRKLFISKSRKQLNHFNSVAIMVWMENLTN